MRRLGVLAGLVAWMFIPSMVMAQGIAPQISAPVSGQVLQGQVPITGTTDVPNFASAELDFAYPSDSTDTWFLIQTFTQPAANAVLTTWDTASITDGDYVLRLRVSLLDGTYQDATVKITIRNETPMPSATPPLAPTATIAPAFTAMPSTPTSSAVLPAPTAPPFPSPTSLPPNPVEVQTREIYAGIQRGALIIVGLFIFFGILIRLRRS